MGARGRHDPLRGGHVRIRPGRPTGSVMSGLVLHTDRTEGTRTAAAALADVLRAGDLLVLDGPLGAGKTTFTQGLGQGLQVRGPVASPTFVIARVHPSLRGGRRRGLLTPNGRGGAATTAAPAPGASPARPAPAAKWAADGAGT